MSFFKAFDITAGYGKNTVISGISFDVPAGSITGIVGANGSGKTTLLNAICGIIPHEGSCVLDGITLDNLKPKQISRLCSYIPQRSGISIDISVLDVVLMGFNPRLGLLEHPGKGMKDSAMEAISKVGLAGRENGNFQTLSEGQKQLCILARTLVSDGKLLLLDEPESALDFRFRYRIMDILKQSINAENRAALVTLHDPQLALNFCDRLVVLHNGQIADVLNVRNDSIAKMESVLSVVYGDVSILSCRGKDGKEHPIIIKEGP